MTDIKHAIENRGTTVPFDDPRRVANRAKARAAGQRNVAPEPEARSAQPAHVETRTQRAAGLPRMFAKPTPEQDAQWRDDGYMRGLDNERESFYRPARSASGWSGTVSPLHARTLQEWDAMNGAYSQRAAIRERQELAYRNYLRSGVESRDLAAGSATGSYFVPPALMGDLIFGLQYFSAILGRSKLWVSVDQNGKPFGGPARIPTITADTSVTDSQIGENTQVGNTDYTFGQATFSNAPIYTGGLGRFGRALMQDAQTDIPSMVNEALAERLGRQLDLDFGATILANATNVVTTAGNAAILLADISALFQKLDPAMLGNPQDVAVVCSNKTLWYLRTQLVDSQSRPIVSDVALTTVSESTEQFGGSRTTTVVVPQIYGVPILVSKSVSDLTANTNVAILANLRRGFMFRYVESSVLRLNERYADFGETGFVGYARADGQIINQAAIAVLKMHA